MSNEPTLDHQRYACSRCAQRQSEDKSCHQCGNSIVQDLTDSQARHYLEDVQSREASKAQSRNIKIAGAAGGVVGFGLVFGFGLGGYLLALGVSFGLALGALFVLDQMSSKEGKFAYLADYE